jgi:hypothetical protein
VWYPMRPRIAHGVLSWAAWPRGLCHASGACASGSHAQSGCKRRDQRASDGIATHSRGWAIPAASLGLRTCAARMHVPVGVPQNRLTHSSAGDSSGAARTNGSSKPVTLA